MTMKNIADILVLFVDDETDTLSGLKRFFRKAPYRKAFAGSGQEALELMEKEQADILVTDALMPKMSGPELIKRVRTRYPEVLCLLITGSNEAEQIVRAVGRDSIFRYLAKPIDPEPFRAAIDSAVDRCLGKEA